MNRNTVDNLNRSDIDIQRSVFSCPHSVKTTIDFGKLVPIECREVLPGDSIVGNTSILARMSTPIYPVMDNAFVDYYHFFVPMRLVWEHSKEFFGEADESAWRNPKEYLVPSLPEPDEYTSNSVGSLLDYMGIPSSFGESSFNHKISALPFRAYHLIWNEWFRDQATQAPVYINKSDDDEIGSNPLHPDTGSKYADWSLTKLIQPVSKVFDYFTGCLPAPQQGDAVNIPLSGIANVFTSNTFDYSSVSESDPGLAVRLGNAPSPNNTGYLVSTWDDSTGAVPAVNFIPTESIEGYENFIIPVNLRSDLASVVNGSTINDLRMAFASQRILERAARSGNRYTEYVRSAFGVVSPDARLQRPEYLGGGRFNLNMSDVSQTSGTAEGTAPLGTQGAVSKTFQKSDGSVNYSATEHGFFFTLVCARTEHTYSQGIDRMFSRRNRFDYYDPALAHIGEQAVYTKELYLGDSASSLTVDPDDVFGYQEAWADLRFIPNKLTGYFRPDVSGSLASWHYGDYYTEAPVLSGEWMSETKENVARTLAVQSDIANQLLLDVYLEQDWYRPLPAYSIPGLVDHF